MTTKRKLFNEVFNAVMTGLVCLAVMLFIQMKLYPRFEPWALIPYLLPCLLAYPAGRFMHIVKPKIAIPVGFGIAALVSLLPIIWLFENTAQGYVTIPLLIVLSFILYTQPYMSGSALMSGGRFAVGGALFLVPIVLKGEHYEAYGTALNTLAIFYFIACLFVYNRESLRYAVSPTGGKIRYPAGMRRSNAIIVVVFVIIALFFANIEAIRLFAIDILAYILSFFFLIMELMAGEDTGTGEGSGGGGMSNPMEGLGGEAQPLNPAFEAFLQVLVIIISAVVVALLVFMLIRLLRKLPALLARLFGRILPSDDAGYTEIIENLSDREKERERKDSRLKRFFDRFVRPATFDDMPDNRSKVRFTYKTMLKSSDELRQGKSLKYMTPNELESEMEKLSEELGPKFIAAYNRARYSPSEITDEETAMVRQMYNLLQ